MKEILVNIVKYSNIIYKIYNIIGSTFINILKVFIKPSDKIILFISFGGKKFDDSPRAIYERMINDSRFDNYDIVWAFQNPEKFKITRGRKIKTDSLNYYITVLKSRCCITNSSVERGLNFKGINTFYFNTWHGTPMKKMGSDIGISNKSFGKNVELNVDIMMSQSKYEADIMSRVFNICRNKFIVYGLPRNDILANITLNDKYNMMKKIGLPLDKKVILYAPTFREYQRDENYNCIINFPINLEKWKNKIGDKYILLIRAHYEITKTLDIKENEFVYNVSEYPELNDLMISSDILISDYSSIFFDYSILNRPMFHFTYDYEIYSKKRGLYFDIRKELLGTSKNEDELLVLLDTFKSDEAIKLVGNFREKYVQKYGNATEKALNKIYKNIK